MLKSRFRKKEKKGGFLPILIPVMNLFLLILPLVIQNAYLQKLTTLDLQLPTISGASSLPAEAVNRNIFIEINPSVITIREDEKKIDEIQIGEGFEERLLSRLTEMKQAHPLKKDILLKVAPQVKYDIVVRVIDQCKKEGKLFPEVVYFDEE